MGADLGGPALRGLVLVPETRVAAFADVRLAGGAVELHVLSQGAGVGVALVAASDLARVGFVTGVHVGMLLPVAAVGEPPVAALELAPKRLFT